MATRSFKQFVEQELGKVPLFLIYAILEWFLIIVLFIDGFVAFFANEFAKFFELEIPCLLCTRIDHVLVRRNADFYYNESICESHKKNVSSRAYCHVHKKLSEIRKMCDACLLSCATEKESDCDTYKSLIGILRKDIQVIVDDDRELHMAAPAGRKEDGVQAEKSRVYWCSCCGEPLKVKFNSKAKNLINVVSHAPTPSPRASFAALKLNEPRNIELPHIRYTELKFFNEPDLNDDEDGSNTFQVSKQFREDAKAAVPLLAEIDDGKEDRTPIMSRGNKFFGISLSDSANNTPRWAARISRKSPLEKTEFASDSADSGLPGEADGDWIVNHLRRQVRLDYKSLMALYMELDEERSASAVAANNAMAMITRLQAEKAAVQMEALQYQRMMEEQAEYDEEALQATKAVLAKREKEMKILEAELEAYREKHGVIKDGGFEGSESEVDENYHDFNSQSYSPEKFECISPTYSSTGGNNNGETMHNGDHFMSLQDKNGEGTWEKIHRSFLTTESSRLLPSKNTDKNEFLSDEGVQSSQCSSDNVNNIDQEIEQDCKANFMRELLQLHERVQVLEAEDGFLKEVDNMPENGAEREKLLAEISDNLQKLRNMITIPIFDDDSESLMRSCHSGR